LADKVGITWEPEFAEEQGKIVEKCDVNCMTKFNFISVLNKLAE
jgi:hypothetical protein